MSFDPFTNKEVHESIMENAQSLDAKKYFVTPYKVPAKD